MIWSASFEPKENFGRPNPWEEFAATHNKNDRVSGTIKSITDFGVFIGLDGGIDGLVHLSDLSWDIPGEEAVRNYKKGDELETNLDQGVVIEQRIVDLQEATTEAENAFRIAKLRYEEGEEDLLNVLTIQQRGISARSSLSSAERLLLEQRVNLNLALGGSWDS